MAMILMPADLSAPFPVLSILAKDALLQVSKLARKPPEPAPLF